MTIRVPKGFLLAGVHCRIKRDAQRPDLSLVMSETAATGVGVYTQNLVFAAPVELDRSRTPSDRIRAVVICSGVANACTGQRGLDDARRMTRLAAAACAASEEQVLVLSTGVIGAFLPMDKIEQGIAAAAVKLGDSAACLDSAARGMLTTDTVTKVAGRAVSIGGREILVTGMAKGAAMMGPNMATMLALIMTDAPLEPAVAQAALRAASDDSFNCMSVDGHMSTNDTVLLVANGAAGGPPLAGDDLAAFRRTLDEVCVDLAKAIAGDGEGRHPFDHHRHRRLRRSTRRVGHRQDRGQQPAGEDRHPRRRSQLGANRLRRRLRRGAVRSGRRHLEAQRFPALSRRRARGVRRQGGLPFHPRRPRHAHRVDLPRGQRRGCVSGRPT